MKKIIVLFSFFLFCNATFSQKSNTSKKPNSSSILAKADNLTLELIKNNYYLFVNNKGAKKDTLFTKNGEGNKKPLGGKIISFSAKGTSLYCINWTENAINQTKEKTEDKTQTHNEIWDANAKSLALENIQTATKIKEIVYLDKLKNASQTSEKIRNEGFVFALTKDGDVVLKNKTQENKMSYDSASKKYLDVKKKK
jgi:hypothetical protein